MRILLLITIFCAGVWGQAVNSKVASDPMSNGQEYVLGPGDQILIHAPNADELSDKPYRVDQNGAIDLPLVGWVHPGGLPVERFETELLAKLSLYLKDPKVNVTVTQYRSERVTFAGAFKTPGVYNLEGRHTLTEMLAIAGGLNAGASRTLTIKRGALNGGELSAGHSTSAVQVMKIDIAGPGGRSAADEFILQPFDLVTATVGDPIFVQGEVAKVGNVDLDDRVSISMIQMLGVCGGLTKDASTKIKIYRPIPETEKKKEIDVNLEKVIKGEEKDPQIFPRDIVYVPRSTSKAMSSRLATVAIGIALAAGSGLAVVR